MQQMKIIDVMNQFEGKQAIKELLFAIATERAKGERLLKITHNGEKTTVAKIHKELKRLKDEGRLSCYLTGKKFSSTNPDVLYLIDKFPFLAEDTSLDKEDEKCTVVFLG